jgi:Spy/CpxP family protein refolding chaperone
MNARSFKTICFTAALLLALGPLCIAQTRGSGLPPPPPPGGAWPGGGQPPAMSPAAQQPHPNQAHRPDQNARTIQPNSAASAGVQFGPVGRWWDNRSVVKTIGITEDQKRRMDSIFNANKPAILSTYQAYLKEQSKLAALSHNPQADQAATFAAIDAVNQARAALQKAAAQTYLQIRQQMKPDQIQKLEKLQ